MAEQYTKSQLYYMNVKQIRELAAELEIKSRFAKNRLELLGEILAIYDKAKKEKGS